MQGHRILTQVYAFVVLELIGQPVDDYVVEVITTQVSITVGRFYFEYTVAQFQDRDIERTTTQVEYGDFHIFVSLVETVGQSGSRRFVDDTAYVQPGNLTGLLRSLTLRVVEVGRYRNHGIGYLLTQIVFGCFFHFLQNHGRNLLR